MITYNIMKNKFLVEKFEENLGVLDWGT